MAFGLCAALKNRPVRRTTFFSAESPLIGGFHYIGLCVQRKWIYSFLYFDKSVNKGMEDVKSDTPSNFAPLTNFVPTKFVSDEFCVKNVEICLITFAATSLYSI
jgi:hypothetical protein